jgi:hypothetical protein
MRSGPGAASSRYASATACPSRGSPSARWSGAPAPADDDPIRGEGTDAGELAQLEAPFERGRGERAHALELDVGDARERVERGDPGGSGERDPLVAVDVDALAERVAQARLQRGRLAHADALGEQEPHAGLERREEAHRPHARVASLERADDRVAPADRGERGGVDVERQDALDLLARRRRIGRPEALEDQVAILVTHAGARGRRRPLRHEGQVQVTRVGCLRVGRGREALERPRGVLQR